MNNNKIKLLIREFLTKEGILKNSITDSKIEFGFEFFFPPSKDPLGRRKGHVMGVFQPKDRDLIVISVGTQISDQHLNVLKDKKVPFYIALRKLFLMKDVFFRIDMDNNRYDISDQIFLKENGTVAKNSFFKSVRKVFNTAAYSNIILNEICYGKIRKKDIDEEKDFSSNIDLSLYS